MIKSLKEGKMTEEERTLTQQDAALGYASMTNRLDATEFIELLAPDVVYESAWVNSDLRGKEKVAEYLTGKMKMIRECLAEEPEMKVIAELAIASPAGAPENRLGFAFHPVDSPDPSSFEVRYFDERPCVLITQAKDIAVAVFEVEGAYIKRFDLTDRRFFDYKRSGIFPE
jgi:hypothetical protein